MHFRGQKKTLGDVSLSDYIETGSDGSPLSFMDVICSQEDLAEQYTERETMEKLHRAVGLALDHREAQIIALRYGFGNRDPLTQHEVADLMGISRSYVSRIEKKALQKLREFMKD
jgi:RNA polymerase sporulation-specific sigma factor